MPIPGTDRARLAGTQTFCQLRLKNGWRHLVGRLGRARTAWRTLPSVTPVTFHQAVRLRKAWP